MKRYSIVSYVEGDIKQQIRNLQKEFIEITGARKCYDRWLPHISIGDGVELKENEVDIFLNKLKKFTSTKKKLLIDLEGFGGKTNVNAGKGVVATSFALWINVILSQSLQLLVDQIQEEVVESHQLWYKIPKPYNPHVTLAHRDLTQEGYNAGLEYLKNKNFSKQIQIDNIAIVEKLENDNIEYKRFEIY